MLPNKKVLVLLFFNLFVIKGYSQIQITFPVSRIVFQRNNQNTATFNVAGNYTVNIDKVEARLTPVVANQGTATDWQTVQNSPNNGSFNGTITAKGGWYLLEVRGVQNNGTIVSQASIDRVGIGEVFLVAGQSNAEGQAYYPGGDLGTTEDRVSSIDFVEYVFNEDVLPFTFTQLGNGKKIGPYNPVPWYWSRLGAKLVEKYNVPVLFYGSALGGSSVLWWAQSANGQDLTSTQPLFIKAAGMPYRGFKGALQHYASRTGLRAVLWHQGESDVTMSAQNYFDNLKTIINYSRSNIEHSNLSWMVARVGNTGGQNQVISQVANIFAGPNTDEGIPDIPQYRFNGHFAYDGLDLAANLWFNNLNDDFFAKSTPKTPNALLPLNVACSYSTTNLLTLKQSTGYNNYRWSDGQYSTDRTIQNDGFYSYRAQNSAGVAFFSQTVYVNNSLLKAPPIYISGPTQYCENTPSSLTVNDATNIKWSSNETSASIFPKTSGSYFATKSNVYGCPVKSNTISVDVKPVTAITLITDKALTICNGDSIRLTASSNFTSYNWSTNEVTKSILVKKAGTYGLKVQNEFGCNSEAPKATIEVKEIPNTPEIARLGVYVFEAQTINSTITPDYYEWNKNSILIPNLKDALFKFNEAGLYKARAVKDYIIQNNQKLSCYSLFSKETEIGSDIIEIGVQIYSNPSPDGIFQIESLNKLDNVSIKVYDLKGVLHHTENVAHLDEKMKVDLSKLTSNNYILKLSSTKVVKSFRIAIYK